MGSGSGSCPALGWQATWPGMLAFCPSRVKHGQLYPCENFVFLSIVYYHLNAGWRVWNGVASIDKSIQAIAVSPYKAVGLAVQLE